jgi:hypothetical protein
MRSSPSLKRRGKFRNQVLCRESRDENKITIQLFWKRSDCDLEDFKKNTKKKSLRKYFCVYSSQLNSPY